MAERSIGDALTCYLNAHGSAQGDNRLRLLIEQRIGKLAPLMTVEDMADAISCWQPHSQTALRRFFALKTGLEETLAIREAARQDHYSRHNLFVGLQGNDS